MHSCYAVDGGWSIWTNWTMCTTSCGEGLQTRSRQCDNPVPRHGGRPCEGLELESAPCIVRSICPGVLDDMTSLPFLMLIYTACAVADPGFVDREGHKFICRKLF